MTRLANQQPRPFSGTVKTRDVSSLPAEQFEQYITLVKLGTTAAILEASVIWHEARADAARVRELLAHIAAEPTAEERAEIDKQIEAFADQLVEVRSQIQELRVEEIELQGQHDRLRNYPSLQSTSTRSWAPSNHHRRASARERCVRAA